MEVITGARWAFGLLAALSAAFTLYGSIVPLDFRHRPFPEVLGAFGWVLTHRLWFESRLDAAVNVLLGVPLGFGLLGLCRVGRDGPRGDLLCGLALLPPCALFAAGVEFLQLYLPERTSAASDIWCQTLGAAGGMAGWMLVGRRVAGPAGRTWARFARGGPAGRLLLGYLAVLAVVQLLPLDLDPNPRDVYRRVRDKARAGLLREFRAGDGDDAWRAVGHLLRAGGLFVPAGLLAARLRGRAGADPLWVLAGAAVVAGGTELLQFGIESRFPSTSDAVAGAAGVMAGWAVGRWCGRGVGLGTGLLLGPLWAAVLLVGFWEPFEFHRPPAPFEWIAADGHVLQDALSTLMLFAPLGAVVAAVGPTAGGIGRLAMAAGVGLAVGAAVEVGQQYLPDWTPAVADVLLGGLGAAAGWWAAARVRG